MKKSGTREWAEAIIFAVFAASFIRMFLIEAYVIPTSSMEGSLKVGDFLFVSKAHYGIRTPMTVLQFPLMHNRLPLNMGESYLDEPSLPYFRLPALEEI
ncbi:MAG: S26 family signal peptidase, partial [Bacteroidota bacterium]